MNGNIVWLHCTQVNSKFGSFLNFPYSSLDNLLHFIWAQELHKPQRTALWLFGTFLEQIEHWEHLSQLNTMSFDADCTLLFLPLRQLEWMFNMHNWHCKKDWFFDIDFEHLMHWSPVAIGIGLWEGICDMKIVNKNNCWGLDFKNNRNFEEKNESFTSLGQGLILNLKFLN